MNVTYSDEIAEVLNEFNADENSVIPPILNQLILKISETGLTVYPWQKLKKLVSCKLDLVITDFHRLVFTTAPETVGGVNTDNVAFFEMKSRLLNSIDKFHGAPFTIQRLCELMTHPMRNYKTLDKFMRGIEKNLLVVSTVDPCGIKIVNESRILQTSPESSVNLPVVDSRPFIAPVSLEADNTETSPSSRASRTLLSPWFMSGHAPSVFDSPSLRGVVSATINCQRQPSPFPVGPMPKKRRRMDYDDIDEESMCSPDKCLRLSPREDDEDEDDDGQPHRTPLLGQLLLDGEDVVDCKTGCHDDINCSAECIADVNTSDHVAENNEDSTENGVRAQQMHEPRLDQGEPEHEEPRLDHEDCDTLTSDPETSELELQLQLETTCVTAASIPLDNENRESMEPSIETLVCNKNSENNRNNDAILLCESVDTAENKESG